MNTIYGKKILKEKGKTNNNVIFDIIALVAGSKGDNWIDLNLMNQKMSK
jgi:hypothetical protein